MKVSDLVHIQYFLQLKKNQSPKKVYHFKFEGFISNFLEDLQ